MISGCGTKEEQSKYRSITNTGDCQKMGCMDDTAKNYDESAEIQIESPPPNFKRLV